MLQGFMLLRWLRFMLLRLLPLLLLVMMSRAPRVARRRRSGDAVHEAIGGG